MKIFHSPILFFSRMRTLINGENIFNRIHEKSRNEKRFPLLLMYREAKMEFFHSHFSQKQGFRKFLFSV